MSIDEFRASWQKRRDDFALFHAQVDGAKLIDRFLADLDNPFADAGTDGGASTRRARHDSAGRSPLAMHEPMLSTKDAATYVGLAPQTLAKMRLSGDSPPFYKLGRRVLYKRGELDLWITQRRRRSTTDTGAGH